MEKITWKTEKRKIDDLKAWEGNPRRAGTKEYEDVKNSLDKFDLADPIIINTDNLIVGGHLRTKILKEKGITEVDVRVPSRKLTEDEMRELNLRLNKNQGKWDFELLANFSEDMLTDVGFESEELDHIFEIESNEDDFNGEQEYKTIKNPKVQVGDVYELESHRLMCGDATKEEDMKKLMNSMQADMVFMDPPYNMNYIGHKHGKILNDSMPEENFVEFSMAFMQQMQESIKAGAAFYICSGYQSYVPFVYAIKALGMEYAGPIIWVKNMLGMGMNDYRHKHEIVMKGIKKTKKKKAQPILYGYNGGRHYFADTREEADVWEIKKRSTNNMVHPTQKPLEIVARALRNSTKRGQIVLDMFGGSGSTLIAAEKEGRICYINELDPKYAEVILNRWEHYTGKKAKKVS